MSMHARIATAAEDGLLAAICNTPEVLAWTAHDGAPPFDPTRYTASPKSFAVIVEDDAEPLGCFLAPALEQGAYGVHTNLLPACRGARALEAAAVAVELAFVSTDAEQLWSMVPANNRRAAWFAHAMGMRDHSRRDGVWPSGGQRHAMAFVRMDIDDWIVRGSLAEMGREFHRALVEQGGHVDHGDDPVHDAYVGAAWAMTAAGNLAKGLRIYNRWARASLYRPYQVLGEEPLRIDIGSCVLRAVGRDFAIEHEETEHA